MVYEVGCETSTQFSIDCLHKGFSCRPLQAVSPTGMETFMYELCTEAKEGAHTAFIMSAHVSLTLLAVFMIRIY